MSATIGRISRLALMGVALAAPIGLLAQKPAAPGFEVAAINPAAPITAAQLTSGNLANLRVGLNVTDARVDIGFMSLAELLPRAFRVQPYQISGPDWLSEQRFDIHATIPMGVSREQVPEMLQGLLAERFKLKLHREKKDLPAYALIVGKNGPKLKESSAEAGVDTFNAAAPPPPPPPGAGTFTAGVRGPLPMGKDGFPQMPPGRGGMFIMMNGGRARLNANQQTMAGLADMLMGQLDRPVLDMTELTKKYDITLEWAPEGRPMGMMGGGMPPPPPPPGGGPGGGEIGLPGPSAPDGQAGPSIFTAVQEQLGLKLEARKAPVEILVIDGGEKVPSEN